MIHKDLRLAVITRSPIDRRGFLAGLGSLALCGSPAHAQNSTLTFPQWVASFRAKALARGISEDTYSRVMASVTPDTSVYALDRAQPEFHEQTWQYINRRVSEWRVIRGRQRAEEQRNLFTRLEREYGVDRFVLLGLWGMESAFGEVVENPRLMRPVLNSLAALAWGEARRRPYWEKELLNALVIIQRGWGTPDVMVGSWAGAMGHTQWMPEVWLNIGVDFDGDGRISPFGKPDDALAGTSRYLVQRGRYRRGEDWGYEVKLPGGVPRASGMRAISDWEEDGLTRANGEAFPKPAMQTRFWQPTPGGPAFLIGQNFNAVKSYNPSMNYTLAIVHLGDRIRGDENFVQPWPNGERPMTLAELQEIQQRLTAMGFDTGGVDGRIGRDTMTAVRNFQQRVGLEPADGYPGLKVLAKLRATR